MYVLKSFLPILLLGLFIQSCQLADIRTPQLKEGEITVKDQQKADELLLSAWNAQGFDKIREVSTYEAIGYDHWKGVLGKIGLLWPDNNVKLAMRFSTGDFDGQVEILEGEHQGYKAGLQSWNFYQTNDEGEIEFPEKKNERLTFGLAAYHYFFEMADRLRQAPIRTYAGETSFNGNEYDLVLVTWESLAPQEKYDQYIAYINKETHLLDAVTYTVRENYLPGGRNLYSTMRYDDYRNVDGFMVPFLQTVQIKDPAASTDEYLHQFRIEEFSFDSFERKVLEPNPSLKKVGDEKPYL